MFNFRILLKSFKFAFRAKKRVLSFIIIYAILFIAVTKGLETAGNELNYLTMAFVVSTIYAILIAQFRKRDIAILKCVSWSNNDILILLIGEVVLVSISAFFLVFQLSVEIIGVIGYLQLDPVFRSQVENYLVLSLGPMLTSLAVIVALQIPGLILAHIRAMRIPPMRALREE
jgi:hypothetical protein